MVTLWCGMFYWLFHIFFETLQIIFTHYYSSIKWSHHADDLQLVHKGESQCIDDICCLHEQALQDRVLNKITANLQMIFWILKWIVPYENVCNFSYRVNLFLMYKMTVSQHWYVTLNYTEKRIRIKNIADGILLKRICNVSKCKIVE